MAKRRISIRKVFIIGSGLLVAVLVFVFIGEAIFNRSYHFPKNLIYGVTFSPTYAQYLQLDWHQVFIRTLDELKVKELRIPTYWSAIEKNEGEFSFEDVTFMITEAEKRGARVILVVGFRQPRWPECHLPEWAADLSLKQKRLKILQFIQKTTERYKDKKSVWAFQVENEPFLPFFGENCDKGDIDFLKGEVELVRSLSGKSIIISDSGELGNWIVPMQLSDIFGSTLYRDVYNPVMGYFSYPVLPYLYNIKSQIVRGIFARKNEKTIIVELQAEPWLLGATSAKSPDQQAMVFPADRLRENIDYAKKVGFDTTYLWGVEWWFWMEKKGYPQYLEYAKTLFK